MADTETACFASSFTRPSFSSSPPPAGPSTSVKREESSDSTAAGGLFPPSGSGPGLTSLCCQVSSSSLQVGAEPVGVGGGEHLLHAGELTAGLQVDAGADHLLLHCQSCGFLPGPPPARRRWVRSHGHLWRKMVTRRYRTWRIRQTRRRSRRPGPQGGRSPAERGPAAASPPADPERWRRS